MANGSGSVADGSSGHPSLSESLTAQFSDWEHRGRGWQVWEHPVGLEPPFRPFFYTAPRLGRVPDDGRRHTLLSGLVAGLSRWLQGRQSEAEPGLAVLEFEDEGPEPVEDASPLFELEVAVPTHLKVTLELAEQLLVSLSYCTEAVGFELLGDSDRVTLQIVGHEADRSQLRQQLAGYFPEALLTERTGGLGSLWQTTETSFTRIVDFGLSREFVRPLSRPRTFDLDPLIPIVGALSALDPGEAGVVQVLFQPVRHPWTESIFRAVLSPEVEPLFERYRDLLARTRRKIGRPLLAAVIRMGVKSSHGERGMTVLRNIASGLVQLGDPSGNELIPLTNDDYPDDLHEADLLLRQTRRSGMLLSSEELSALVHLPSASVRSPKLLRIVAKTRPAPTLALGHSLVLGTNTHDGEEREVTLSADQRVRHTYVIGASGTGKSSFLLSLMLQDADEGQGFALLDPHGDLVDEVLARLPEKRRDDVILLDASDAEFPIGFNILSAHSEVEKHLLASDLVGVFRRLSTSWGDQMTSVLGNAILAFLESERGGTLADLRRFLVEPEFRRAFLPTVRDPEVVYFWQKEFPLLAGKPQAPLLTRLDTFLRPLLIRHMVAQKENRLDFASIMNGGKIFLARLAQGAIGEENAYLLGSLLVSKFHQMTLSRQEVREADRRPYYLYLDEFHNFITPSMAQILSGARKYRLGLILAHQELRQLGGRDSELTSAVIANPYTRVCFRLGDQDATRLAEGFSFFEAKDLQNLGTGEAICRLERAEYDFNLKTAPPVAVSAEAAREQRERIIAFSRERYGTPRAVVEEELAHASPRPRAETERRSDPKTERDEVPAAIETEVPRTESPVPSIIGTRVVETIPVPEKPRRTLAAAAPALLGRGGQQHKYLQQLIKQWAEGMGYRATIELPILDGAGSVDVALEKGTVTIACEISVTSTVEQELGNLEKCLKAGFTRIAMVSPDVRQVGKIRAAAEKELGIEKLGNIDFVTPEALFGVVEKIEAISANTEATVKGYKVKVKYRAPGEEERQAKKQVLSSVLVQSLRRLRGKDKRPPG